MVTIPKQVRKTIIGQIEVGGIKGEGTRDTMGDAVGAGNSGGEKEIRMGLVKTRRLAYPPLAGVRDQ